MVKALVITPTTGAPELEDAIASVKKQTMKCDHLVIVDGQEFSTEAGFAIARADQEKTVIKTVLPFNTGANGFYGHRVMAGFSHLVNHDYILFLDQDNWYEPNHVETLIETIESKNLDFSFSLRKIFNSERTYLLDDNCESLGKWPIFMSRHSPHGLQYLIDTSSFCFRREFIQKTCHHWHAGWGGDRQYLYAVKNHAKYDTNGKHTLCYRLDGNPNSVTKEFFETGNKTQQAYYEGKYPWLKM